MQASGYDLLFTVLALLAGAVAARTALMPQSPRNRSTLLDLTRRLAHPSFVAPVSVLALAAALSLGALTSWRLSRSRPSVRWPTAERETRELRP